MFCIQKTCQNIIDELKNYDKDETDLSKQPQIGDLVYGLYEIDDSWYRCLVTNCDETRTNYELFYIDFGNTELASRQHILAPHSDEHTRPLVEYEPQAYKCDLYGVCNNRDRCAKKIKTNDETMRGDEVGLVRSFESEFTEAENEKFKNSLSNKIFSVQFLDESGASGGDGEHFYHVSLNEIVSDSKSVFASGHKYVLKEKIGI